MPLAFPADQLAKARAAITDSGESIAEWSRRNNLDLQMTGHVLRGSLKATRGEAYRVAVALGLRKKTAKKRVIVSAVSGKQVASLPRDGEERRKGERRIGGRRSTDCTSSVHEAAIA